MLYWLDCLDCLTHRSLNSKKFISATSNEMLRNSSKPYWLKHRFEKRSRKTKVSGSDFIWKLSKQNGIISVRFSLNRTEAHTVPATFGKSHRKINKINTKDRNWNVGTWKEEEHKMKSNDELSKRTKHSRQSDQWKSILFNQKVSK